MHRSALLAVLGLVACRAPVEAPPAQPSPAEPPSPGAPAMDPAPTSTSEPAPTPMSTPTHVLALHEPAALDGDDTLRVESIVIESIEPSPEDPEAYPGGSGIDVSVVVQRGAATHRAELGMLSEGYQSRPTAWLADYRITLLDVTDPHRAPKVALLVERVTDQLVSEPAEVVRATKDREVRLRDGMSLTLRGHGHKRTMAGQRSPLMIAVRWDVPGYPPEDQDTGVGPNADDMTWSWRDLSLTVGDYDYDAWMELSIVHRRLERVEPPSAEPSP